MHKNTQVQAPEGNKNKQTEGSICQIIGAKKIYIFYLFSRVSFKKESLQVKVRNLALTPKLKVHSALGVDDFKLALDMFLETVPRLGGLTEAAI